MKQHSPRESEFSHRSPYLDNYRSFREPMTVLASLLSRADNTPLDQRRRDPNTLLDQEGKAIADPADPSQKLALAGDPNTSYEKWGEYWRKVHGPRFIYAQDTEEGKIRHLARYDQGALFAGFSAFLVYAIPAAARTSLSFRQRYGRTLRNH